MQTPKSTSRKSKTSAVSAVCPALVGTVPVTIKLHPLAAAVLSDYAAGESGEDAEVNLSMIASHILRKNAADFVTPVKGQPRCFFVNLTAGYHMRITGIAGDNDEDESFVLAEAILSGIRSLEALKAAKVA